MPSISPIHPPISTPNVRFHAIQPPISLVIYPYQHASLPPSSMFTHPHTPSDTHNPTPSPVSCSILKTSTWLVRASWPCSRIPGRGCLWRGCAWLAEGGRWTAGGEECDGGGGRWGSNVPAAANCVGEIPAAVVVWLVEALAGEGGGEEE